MLKDSDRRDLASVDDDDEFAALAREDEEFESLARPDEEAGQLLPVDLPLRSVGEAVETFGKGAWSAATLGLSEPAFAKLESLLQGYPVEQAIERRRQLKEQYAPSEIAGEVAGGLVGPVAKLGGLAAGAAETALGKIAATKLGQATKAATGAIGREAGEIAKGAAAGAAQAPIAQAQLGVEQAAGVVKPEEMPSTGALTGFGAALGGGIPALKTLGKAGKAIAGTAMTAALGPNRAVRARYLQQPKEVTAFIEQAQARQLQQLAPEQQEGLSIDRGMPRTIVTEEIQKATAPIKAKETELGKTLVQAQEQETSAKQAFDSAVTEKKRMFEDELKQSRRSSEEATKIKRDLFRSGITPEFEADVKIAADKLKEDIIKLSGDSYRILDNTPGEADFSGIKEEIDLLKEPLKTGTEILSEAELKAARIADYWANKLQAVGGETGIIPFRLVKRSVQSIDADLRNKAGLANRSKFSDQERTMLLKIRKIVDSKIKGIPEYASLMDEVYRKTQINEDVGNFLGDEKAVNLRAKLSKLWKPGEPGLQTIVDLGKEVNEPFDQILSDYAAMKQVGASQAQSAQAIAALPEQIELAKMQRRQELARRPELKYLLAPAEHKAWVKSQEDVIAVENAISALEAEVQNFKGAYNQPYNFVMQSMSGLKPELRMQLDALRNATGQDFERQIRAAATAEALMRPYVQGSRRTLLVKTVLGGLVGGAVGPAGGGAVSASTFSAIGAALGAMLDEKGGLVTKGILDGFLAIRGIPTIQKITTAFSNVPEDVRQDIANSFVRAVLSSKKAPVQVRPEDTAQMIYDIQQSSGLSSIEKAKALQQLQNLGFVDTSTIGKVMLAGEATEAQGLSRLSMGAIKAERRQ